MTRIGRLLLLAIAGATPLAAQQPDTASAAVAAAQRSAGDWLRLVDGGRYEESWDSAAAVFRDAVPRPAWRQAVVQARGPFEPLGGRKLLTATYTTALPNAPPGRYVVLQYETRAAGDRSVVETVTPMQEPGGAWRVSGYFVRPR